MLSRLTQRRGLFAASAALLAAGVALLAFGAFAILDDGGSDNIKPPATSVVISRVSSSTPTPTAGGPVIINNSPVSRLVVDSIGIDTPIMTLGLDAAGVPEVPNYQNSEDAADIVAWYDFSALPGQGTNAVFAGHITWDGPGVFLNLENLQPGDKVSVFTEDGKQLQYQVFENLLVDPSRVDLLYGTPEDIVTLISCGGAWVPNPNDPFGGNYDNRIVVRAKLIGQA